MAGNETREAQSGSGFDENPVAEWHSKAARSDRLLVRMNYEIRTAVNLILGMTDVIRGSELSPNLSKTVTIARATAERLLKESTEIIDLARAGLGSLQLCSARFILHDAIQQAMDLMSILASSKRITLKFHMSRQAPTAVIGDPERLSQILITLVRASIERLEQGEICINVENDSIDAFRIRVSVVDNGRRIPPEQIRSMFDCRIDHESTMRAGSERALILAGHLARMMGGDLWAEEEPPIGCAFHFTVNLRPVPIVDVLRMYKTGVATRTDLRPLKILIADDSADTLLLIRALLEDAPWGIESVDNGRAALEMAVSKTYDLILMDLEMPEMNGYVAARQIRISEYLNKTRAVPIIALTAHNEAEAASKSIEAGCTAHVTKPIRKAALVETIQRYAGDRRSDSVRR
jgi:CheY-like chemotaxis protein